ncbi:threonine/homoserine efflux transporter RhtA [Kribbella sp. VKM Ac-2527]|uniref:Threonine/homoserine efflux transporter RhtA n=1 Tax=Kribbella caucasensis TaxID=2512215 RepID=A0A4R6J6C0_9ACTN|nr:DMT family transporter [Kribbella sp. VKM Ac-2527]TDO29825.1 threonine/homoserine efflux transporter RhtA [Kribbella sp. VKM Ac-2527]
MYKDAARVKSAGLGFAIFSAITFGGSGPFAKALIGAGLSPQQAAWLRILGAAALLVPLVLIFRGSAGIRAARASWPQLVLYGLTGIAGCQTLFFIAASRLPVGVAILLEFSGPVLVVAWLKFGRKVAVPKSAALGVGIALIGLATVVEIWSGLQLDLVGLLAGLGAAACQATYFILIDKLTGVADPLVMTAAGSVVGALLLTAISAPWAIPWNALTDTIAIGERSAPGWVFATWLIVVSTVIAYLAGAAAVQRLSAAIGGAVAYVEVVAASLFAWILLNETLRTNQIIGGAIVLLGAFVAQSSVGKVAPPEVPQPTRPDADLADAGV